METVAKQTWATTDIANVAEVELMLDQEASQAEQRVIKMVMELRDLGIVNHAGRKIFKNLPPRDDTKQERCIGIRIVSSLFLTSIRPPNLQQPNLDYSYS